jgi:hypothetical protein
MPFLAQFPKSPLICTVRTTSGCVQTQNHLDLRAKPPRSACKFTSVTVQNHLDLRACLCLHQNSHLRIRVHAHLNNEKKNQKGGVAIGHAPTQIPPISEVFKVNLPPLATSHGGGALVDVVVRGWKSQGQTRGLLLPCICDWLGAIWF